MYRATRVAAKLPRLQVAPETKPVMWTMHFKTGPWGYTWNGVQSPYAAVYRETHHLDMWPCKEEGYTKKNRSVLNRWYSPAALHEALAMIPPGFETRDVPRPPQRIRAHSDGIVGRWYTNFWTLHSIKYQCLLARIPWRHGERVRPTTNFEEPYYFVDYEESKMLRDWRSRWINANRSMVGMSKKVKEVEEENRYLRFKKLQDTYWTDRKVLINRVKSMRQSGALEEGDALPVATMRLRAFDQE